MAKKLKALQDLQPQRQNANRHTQRGLGLLEDSIQRDGWIGAITVAADGETFDGSARIEGGVAAGFNDAIVVESDGSKPVVLVRTDIPNADDLKAKRLGIAANRVAQVDLEWAPDVLAQLAEDGVKLDDLWSRDELSELLADVKPEPGGGGDEFDATPADGPTRCQPGQLWRLGKHRLLCGDSTKAEDVARLMGGEKAEAVVTDPPYGQSQKGITNDEPEKLSDLVSGAVADLPVQDAIVVSFQSPRTFTVWLDAIRAKGHQFERMLWFYKAAQCTYPWRGWLLKSEAILVSVVGNGKWQDVHPYSHDCYYLSELSAATSGFDSEHGWHGSTKPLSIVSDLMQRVCSASGLVYDPFLGSGTTIIAAERLGRRCYGLEIAPKYCDVILRRAEAEGIAPIEQVE